MPIATIAIRFCVEVHGTVGVIAEDAREIRNATSFASRGIIVRHHWLMLLCHLLVDVRRRCVCRMLTGFLGHKVVEGIQLLK